MFLKVKLHNRRLQMRSKIKAKMKAYKVQINRNIEHLPTISGFLLKITENVHRNPQDKKRFTLAILNTKSSSTWPNKITCSAW